MWTRRMVGILYVTSYLGSSVSFKSPNGFVAAYGDHRYPEKSLAIPTESFQASLSCGGNVTEETDIQSPNYPDPFNPDEWCVWWAKAEEGMRARVTFHDFQLHGRLTIGKCWWDHLEIRTIDPQENGEVYCGKDISPGQVFISEDQDLVIVFYGGDINTHTGFSATIDFL
ncbi:unnamed protein product [Meganyctiphanes norvegica]|uniref:CUB domain-containing protein n=1 Tax=Meganyctiphanes norvegica TaxID=48144 RepID=A0AAV2SF64_MEGNR